MPHDTSERRRARAEIRRLNRWDLGDAFARATEMIAEDEDFTPCAGCLDRAPCDDCIDEYMVEITATWQEV